MDGLGILEDTAFNNCMTLINDEISMIRIIFNKMYIIIIYPRYYGKAFIITAFNKVFMITFTFS